MIRVKQKFAGFTLLEVIITMVVLAIGLLGLASLQGIALKSTSSIQFYSQANILAHSILDNMRVNRQQAKDGAYNIDLTSTPIECTNDYDVTTVASSLAEQDLEHWTNNLACTLPNGTGIIDVNTDANNNSIVVITVQWDNRREQSVQSDQSDESTRQVQVVSNL